ncbi:MAG TPA: helix-turn-helix domain-containing protein, partial [Longimicrobiales bacterium]|nr:helix-turn-helix domain-containing protein [Longimicrobiales bacterium]
LRRAAVARLLRQARQERGLTLREAAALAIRSHLAVSLLERGRTWSRELAERLAAAYAERAR